MGACSSDLPKEFGRVVARFIKDTGMDRLKMFYAGFRGLKGNSGASSGLVCRSVLSWGFDLVIEGLLQWVPCEGWL